MPRLPRLDITGLLQHVIVRGIERRDIFDDEHDRQLFADRLFSLLPETGVRCYAWELLSNHFHLLLMPTTTPLLYFMRLDPALAKSPAKAGFWRQLAG